MSLLDFAKSELALLRKHEDDAVTKEDAEMQDLMDKHILELVEAFSKQGHSGFSANYAVSILTRLLRWEPLTPLTGEDNEWHEVKRDQTYDPRLITYQNKRYSSVFKTKNPVTGEVKTYELDGKVFSDDGGKTWYTRGGGESHRDVTFPYTPTEPERVIVEKTDKRGRTAFRRCMTDRVRSCSLYAPKDGDFDVCKFCCEVKVAEPSEKVNTWDDLVNSVGVAKICLNTQQQYVF